MSANKVNNEAASVSRTERTCSGSVYTANVVLACTAEATVCPVQPYPLHCSTLHKSTAVCQHVRTHKPKVNKLGWKCVFYCGIPALFWRCGVWWWLHYHKHVEMYCDQPYWLFMDICFLHAELLFHPFTSTHTSRRRLCLIRITGSQQGLFSWMERLLRNLQPTTQIRASLQALYC